MPSPVRPPLPGWPHPESPFHAGERRAQARAGIGDKLEAPGRRIIRGMMPDDHRELFEKLPYLVVGAVDDHGWPWASLLTGSPGFVSTPDAHTLRIRARPSAGDPVAALLTVGRSLGVLGIELATRRRNRANGTVTARDEALTVAIAQSFGNCPQYIQARRPVAPSDAPPAAPTPEGALLSETAQAVVRRADTFFLATSTPGKPLAPSDGVDVSHRGGKPGFLAVERTAEQSVLLAPDFRGNFLFNTLGNLELNPRAGVLVADFDSGALLSLTCEARALWEDPRIAQLQGAERLLELRVRHGVLLRGALPWRWTAAELAPQLAATGDWPR
jgi:uncharacterized protein